MWGSQRSKYLERDKVEGHFQIRNTYKQTKKMAKMNLYVSYEQKLCI